MQGVNAMSADYTEYNLRYRYMSNLLRQIQGLSAADMNMSASHTEVESAQSGESFTEVYERTLSDVKAPESMDAIFEEAAEKYGVPSALLKAMGKAESNFNAKAVSSAGAQGVMQLMPGTAKALGVKDPFDARSNIMGGAKYISQKLKKYNGNIELALAAYNAGSGNVAKYGGVPPFKETRNYIKRIKKYMQSDIRIDQTVYSRKSRTGSTEPMKVSAARTAAGAGKAAGTYGQQDALYFVEMLKVQMQNRMSIMDQYMSKNGINL